MSTIIAPQSAEASKLEEVVKQEISGFGLDEDPGFVAQYVVLMICNNKTESEITSELSGLFGSGFNEDFTQWVFEQARRIQAGESDVDMGRPSGVNDNDRSSNNERDNISGEDYNSGARANSNFGNSNSHAFGGGSSWPNRPVETFKIKGSSKLARNGGGGISKGYSSNKLGGHTISNINNAFARDQQQQHEEVEQRERGFQNSNNNEFTGRPRLANPRANRCRHWPTCDFPMCNFGHPRKKCWAWPDCPNAPGTCSYLHPGQDYPEDGDPSQIFAVQQFQAMHARPGMQQPFQQQGFQQQPFQRQPYMQPGRQQFGGFQQAEAKPLEAGIQLCRFKDKCANKTCPFGHPTPVNSNSQVQKLEWCPNKEKCENAECDMAHPSGSLVRNPEPIPQKVLETCKFLDACTNPRCRYRHPISPIICRNGVDCQRADCIFTHPYREACKFSVNCRNANCLYQHPPERDEAMNMNKSMSWTKSERQFATTDESEVEKVIPGQDQQAQLGEQQGAQQQAVEQAQMS